MKVAIVGVGAIGSLWASKLQQQGHQVICFTRDPSQTQLTLQLDDQPQIKLSANQPNELAICDVVLITVKSTQVKNAIEPLFAYLSPTTPIIFLHNGMGAVDELDAKWQAYSFYLATTTQAAFKPNAVQVKHTGHGSTLIGPYSAQQEKLSECLIDVLNTALVLVAWDEDIQTALWKKLAVNCVINPMTAVYQCQNGDLAKAQYQIQLQDLIQECHQVMQAAGQTLTLEELSKFIEQVIQATAQNYSSMYQDIHHQRPTEIEFITGYLLKQAQRHNIEVPNHQRLYQQVKQLEK